MPLCPTPIEGETGAEDEGMFSSVAANKLMGLGRYPLSSVRGLVVVGVGLKKAQMFKKQAIAKE
jgi:hypothetical protein